MGLDMYLSAKRYLFTHEHGDAELAKKVSKLFPDAPGKPTQIEVEAMYWRKANEIHHWFVQNVQGGKDDCGEYDVPIEKLRELYGVVSQVLQDHDKAPTLLPTKEGFFFGGTEYDKDYFADLEHTRKELAKLLVPARLEGTGKRWDFYYQASW